MKLELKGRPDVHVCEASDIHTRISWHQLQMTQLKPNLVFFSKFNVYKLGGLRIEE